MHIEAFEVSRPLAQDFRISRGTKTHAHSVIVKLSDNEFIGKGECLPYPRYGGSPKESLQALSTLHKSQFELEDFQSIQQLALPMDAKNALDCAVWDLRAKQSGKRVWELMDITEPKPLRTAQTLSLDTPKMMANSAQRLAPDAVIKVKLGSQQDLEAIRAIRFVRPQAQMLIDANEGWSVDDYQFLIHELHALHIALIEQPLRAEDDEALADLPRPIPLCADESFHAKSDISRIKSLYDCINIKLDKTGGLTPAYEILQLAKSEGLKIMMGCMVASSLSMAPAFLLAGKADFVDLDGPLFLKEDIEQGIDYQDGIMQPYNALLWG